MSVYETIVCDRCGTERKKEQAESWDGWKERAGMIQLDSIASAYSHQRDFVWQGSLCGMCADEVDTAVRS